MTAIILFGVIVICHIPLYWFAGYGMAAWRERHPLQATNPLDARAERKKNK